MTEDQIRTDATQSGEDPARTVKISALRAKYQSGSLEIDAARLASKLVDGHLSAGHRAHAATAEPKEK